MSDKYAALKQAADGAFSSWSRNVMVPTKEILALLAEREADKARIAVLQSANAAQDDHINQQQDRIEQLEKGHQEAAKQINSWRRLAKKNISEREKDLSALDAARRRIAELEASHSKLRDAMAAIHNTIRLDGVNTSLSSLLSASKRAWEESADVMGINLETGE